VAQLEVFGCRQQRQRVRARELLQLGQRVRAFAIVHILRVATDEFLEPRRVVREPFPELGGRCDLAAPPAQGGR
jgi:hypothetical protein